MEKSIKKDKNWKIRIWDLIVKTWSQDIIDLKNKFLENVNNITQEWISCKVEIWSINKEDILVKIIDINCQMKIECDICGDSYLADIYSPEYTCIFTTDEKRITQNDEQEYYPITNDMSVDIADIINFAINLELTTVNRCSKCQKNFDNSNDDEESDYESTINHINII